MGNIKKFYENTENAGAHPNVIKFVNMKVKPTNAIDLGCGAGRDTVFLIKNGWDVLAVDRENTSDIILSKLEESEKEKFRFSVQEFENINLEKTNLLTAHFSIPFCDKERFPGLWSKIVDSILPEGYFVRKFFWFK